MKLYIDTSFIFSCDSYLEIFDNHNNYTFFDLDGTTQHLFGNWHTVDRVANNDNLHLGYWL